VLESRPNDNGDSATGLMYNLYVLAGHENSA